MTVYPLQGVKQDAANNCTVSQAAGSRINDEKKTEAEAAAARSSPTVRQLGPKYKQQQHLADNQTRVARSL